MSNLLRDIGKRAAGDCKVAAPTGGTCQWIRDQPAYQTWESRVLNLLWVQAPPGFGKTVLAAYIATQLRADEEDVILRFHFRPNVEAKSESLYTMLWTLLHQLVSRQGAENTSSEQRKRLRHMLQPWSSEPSLGRLWELLSSMLEVHRRYTIIIDGLDECNFSGESELETPRGVIQKLELLAFTGKGRVAVFCRPRPDLRKLVNKASILAITPKMLSADLEVFLAFLFHTRYTLPQDLFDSVLNQVRSQAQGSFQWVLLYIQHIAAAPSQTKRQKRISSFPTPLSDAYTKVLDDQDASLDEDERKQRRKIFQAVLVARRTLTLDELTESHDLPADKAADIVVRLCSPLIEIQDDRRVVSTHSSVKDFFLSDKTPTRYRFSLDEANLLHAKKALKRLLQPELATLDCIESYLRSNNNLPPKSKDRGTRNFGRGPYLDHAAHMWAEHVVAVPNPPPSLLTLVATFTDSDQSVFWGEYLTAWHGTKEATLVVERNLRKWLKTLKPNLASLVTLDKYITKPYYRVSKRFDSAPSPPAPSNPADGPKLFQLLTRMALFTFLYEKGDSADEPLCLSKSTTEDMTRLLGADHRLSLKSRGQEASAYIWAGFLCKAIVLLESLASSQQRVLGKDRPEMWQSIVHIGRVKFRMNDLTGAWDAYTRALEGLDPVVGEKDMFYISTLAVKEAVFLRTGEVEKAVENLKLLYDRQVEDSGPEDGLAVWLQATLGEGYRRLGERKMALEHLRASYEYRQYQLESAGGSLKVDAGITLIVAYREFGMLKEARKLLEEVKGTFLREKLPERWGQLVHLDGLLKADGGDAKGAMGIMHEYALLMRREDYNRGFMWLLLDLAMLLRHLGKADEASSLFHHVVKEREKTSKELEDEPSSSESLRLAEKALTLYRKEDITGAKELLKANGFVWVREEDLWCWQTASPQAPDTAAMKPPMCL
ncbi:hypothetical protein QBC34DRAFT_413633 [Podospora aff. communis PSN243]|uniref:NACHT domain-containing protein n=1 Tax=Podospora aff. communis PSN243 TaxID=3040156 RepID=A0AAV9G9S5_9PEZI|nr:hypothetical protein QBC34DRAFT_413633 [Podospora aff. communis PSN243]